MTGISDSFESRIAARRRNFKKASGDANDMRRRREDATVQIRKKEKEDQLVRRRRLGVETEEKTQADFKTPSKSATHVGLKEEDIPALKAALSGSDEAAVMEALVSFRKLLSREDRPPIQNVIDAGVLPRFKELLDNPMSSKMQFEAAWALTNIASGNHDQTLTVVELGAVESFRKLLSSKNAELQEQSIWAVANIAGDGPGIRDQCLRLGILQPLLDVIRAGQSIGLVRLGTWALSNFCRGKPAPPLEIISPALATLAMVLGLDDREALTDALWAVSYLCDGPSERIEAVLMSGAIPRIVQLLGHDNPSVHTPALRAIGNVVTGEAHQTAAAVDAGLVLALKPLLRSSRKMIRKEAVWTLSNICADKDIQIQKVIDSGLLAEVFEMILGAKEHEIRREAVWVVCNLCTGGTPAQVRYVVDHYKAISAICTVLNVKDSRMVQVALEAIEGILKVGSEVQEKSGASVNRYLELLEECGGLDKIEELQQDSSKDVYERAVSILEGYCEVEEENGGLGNGNIMTDGLGSVHQQELPHFAFA
ncbi:importin alpha, putative [Perkinsus marinus ATCC 50983]|uniref:Importin subunit alpha n=1 Tax=Perkinsus marinus (strain ATCC 50983 / TXsc) TaxID=423536 RepID=C5KJX9_PERM5|nr:importin alpha, putative [Perkinsus marinus ATCC 50983]EER15237.1 importin alpha, putative [Perkinsus marinus ATCC 50983]|eukprot:XP_002783441.1 importin alpha, putative [Perkinsus marinus ATCC 50983]